MAFQKVLCGIVFVYHFGYHKQVENMLIIVDSYSGWLEVLKCNNRTINDYHQSFTFECLQGFAFLK